MARTPRYVEIADDLRRRLGAGEWSVGSTIPGISALQAEYEVAGLQTIRQAQSVLQEEGLLEPRQGSGTFVIGLPGKREADRSELRHVITDLQHALGAAQATLNRLARQLNDEHRPESEPTRRADRGTP
jgi:DNA-binding GntR family transcriptional regulator